MTTKFKTTASWDAARPKPTWECLNADCCRVFSTTERNPSCPVCGCIRVTPTVAAPSILNASTRQADKTLREVAASFGLTNLKSARAGEAAHPGLPTAKVIPGAPPLNAGMGVQIPRTMTPSAQFAATPRQLRGQIPTGYAFNKRGKGRVPTKVRHVADERGRIVR